MNSLMQTMNLLMNPRGKASKAKDEPTQAGRRPNIALIVASGEWGIEKQIQFFVTIISLLRCCAEWKYLPANYV